MTIPKTRPPQYTIFRHNEVCPSCRVQITDFFFSSNPDRPIPPSLAGQNIPVVEFRAEMPAWAEGRRTLSVYAHCDDCGANILGDVKAATTTSKRPGQGDRIIFSDIVNVRQA